MAPGEAEGGSLRCGVLGEVTVVAGSRAPGPGGGRPAAVLAALLVERARARSVDELVDLIWGEDAPPTAATMVHQAVRRLRAAAGVGRDGFVVSRAGRYALAPGVGLDAADFEALVTAAAPVLTSEPDRAARLLTEALALWRGPAYSGVEAPFARDEAARLDERRLRATEMLAEAELARGEPDGAVALLEPLVAADPTREHAAGRLMIALTRVDRTADAVRVSERVRGALDATLGVGPGPALRAVEDRVRAASPTSPGPGRPPRPLSSFVGREDDLTRVGALLAAHRLVTVTGPGGTGKTRLALEAARRDPARTVFVDLARAASAERFDDTVAEAIGVRPGPSALADVVARALDDEATLLVLDNAEHLLERGARFARDLLAAAADVRVLATSRERLDLPGEHVHLLDPLPVPRPGATADEIARSAAVRLFLARAGAVRTCPIVGEEGDTALIGGICRRLDGLPLALELAAARTAALSLPEIAAGLDDRFALLVSRHAGLAATIAWSRDLLDEDARGLFDRLGVFPASFDLDAVRAVTGDDATLALGRLVDASLVRRVGGARYRMLESTRAYAVTGLAPGELAVLRRRHAHHVLGRARRAAAHLFGAGSGPWLNALHAARDDLRAALSWAAGTGGESEVLAGLCGALWHYWDVRGSRAEGVRWLRAALSGLDEARPELLSALALLHLGRGEFDDAQAAAAEQRRLALAAGDRRWEGDAQGLSATVDWARGRFDRAQQRYEDAIEASLAGGDVWRAAMEEAQLARLHRDRAEPDAARALARRAADHAAAVGEELARGLAADVLASVEARWGDPADARRLVEAALGHYRLVGYHEGEASALALSARLSENADPARARAGYAAAHDIFRRIGHRAGTTATAEALAALD